MGDESDENPEMQIPDTEDDVIDMAGAETEEEQNLAVTQARLIGDLPDE